MTFDEYKARVSIIQVAEDLGYKLDRSKGKVSPCYKLTDEKGNKIDEIVIKNPLNSSNQHYFDRNYKGGDVIAFVRNHIDDFPQFQHKNDFVRLNMILSHYSNTEYVPKEDFYKGIKEHTPFDPARYKQEDANLSQLSYLTQERKISPSTVETFLPFIQRVKDTEQAKDYVNIAFPYTVPGTDKVNNYEFRNYGFKGMAEGGDKQNSLWIADFANGGPATAKHVYFSESALDMMSFYELNKNKIKLDESVFCSVGGYLTHNQIANTVSHYQNAKVHTCFDNDINGAIYDIKVHSILAKKDVEIKKSGNSLEFKTGGKEFSIDKEEVSLNKFRELSGSVVPMTVHKPKGEKDFNEILKNQQPQRHRLSL